MSEAHVDYLESLFQGIDIIVDKKLENVAYDTTIVCTVVDDSNSKNGEYQVTDGTIKFKAYSENQYKVDDQVRVSIPKGDYTGVKFIVGKYVANNDAIPITYVSPLDTVVDITGNLFHTNVENYATEGIQFTANGLELNRILFNEDLPDSTFSSLQDNGIFSTIYMKADFQTLFSDYDIIEGTYGLRLDLLIKPTAESAGRIHQYIELTSDEMFGNPYQFAISTPQSKVVDIKNIGTIDQIILSVFQNGDFKDRNRGYLPIQVFPNIIIRNIELGFGSDLTNVDDNVLKIYTLNDLVYSYQGNEEGSPTEHNTKTLNLLWYNKNESNKYIGFSDGIYSPTYDEIEYLNQSRSNERLVAQMGKENVATDEDSLRLKANILEVTPLLTKAKQYVDRDLISTLNAFTLQFAADDTQNREPITVAKEIILEKSNNIAESMTRMLTQYDKVLEYGYKVQPNPESTELNGLWETDWDIDNYSNIVNFYANIKNEVSTLLSGLLARITDGADSSNNGYQGVYDTYLVKFNRVTGEIDKNISKVTAIAGNDVALMRSYNRESASKKTNWIAYSPKDFSADANKYCIYWYRYEKGYVNEEEMFMEPGWCRLTSENVSPSGTDFINLGLPGQGETIDNKLYYKAELDVKNGLFDITMKNDLAEEKFMAIIFYNHDMYKSNELVFTNDQHIVDKDTLDKTDVVVFEHLDNSSDAYYLYTDTNYLIDSAEAYKFRKIRCHYDGVEHQDEILNGAGIYWYIPQDSTMINVDVEELKSRGFTTDYDEATPQSRENYWYFYRQIRTMETELEDENGNKILSFASEDGKYDTRDFWYKIKPFYENGSRKNVIECEIHLENDDNPVYGEEFFSFGIASTNGTKYTLAITNQTNQTATMPNADLPLEVSLRDYSNKSIDIYRNGSVIDENITSGFNSTWYFKLNGSGNVSILPASDPVRELLVTRGSCGILNNKVTLKDTNRANGIVDLECLYSVPWAANDYYMSGPTSIIYNNQGALDNRSMFDSPYRLFWTHTANGHVANEEVAAIWTIEYYKSDGSLETNDNITQYMPRINEVGGLTPQTMYISDINCYAVVCAKDSNGNYLWKQPIIILQNRFGSPLLNNWDGSLQIDETNNTIMTAMIGAGRKNPDNSFSGVLMGDVTSENVVPGDKEGLGIYGFHHGAQSFGLNIDGTAFFGKSGRGRIEIDGNDSVIRSSAWTKNNLGQWVIPNSGTLLDLDDAMLLMRDSTVGPPARESYFYFNKNKEGKLEVLANGVDIKLNNKSNAGLTPYIETSAQKIVAEVRRAANYYGTCATDSSFVRPATDTDPWTEINDNKIKVIDLTLDVGEDMVVTPESTDDFGIDNINVADILQTGTTIAITFTNAQLVKEEVTNTDTTTVPGAEDSPIPTRRTVTYTGHTLQLNIEGEIRDVYFDKRLTANDNPFGWSAGSTVYFTYDAGVNAWFITDSGAYSRTMQTAEFIRSEVSDSLTATASTINQTANSIRLETRRYAGYYGTCDNTTANTTKQVKIMNLPDIAFDLNNLLQNGIGLAVTFTHKDTISPSRTLSLQLGNSDGTVWNTSIINMAAAVDSNGVYSWEPGSTVYFVYNNAKWVVTDAGNYARITQTANQITSEVRRTASYYGTSSSSTDSDTKEVSLINKFTGGFTTIKDEEIFQTGVTIAVTFSQAENTTQTSTDESANGSDAYNNTNYSYNNTTYSTEGRALFLKVLDQTFPVYIEKAATSKTNPFGWSAGSTVYFTYVRTNEGLATPGRWEVSDSGSYSNITQTADKIQSDVTSLDNKTSSRITQTANAIKSEVRKTAGYACISGDTVPDSYNNHIAIITSPLDHWTSVGDFLQAGVTISVEFKYGQTEEQIANWSSSMGLILKLNSETSSVKPVIYKGRNVSKDNKFSWETNDVISMCYTGSAWAIVDSGAYSKIKQTADSITMEVRSDFGYACVGNALIHGTNYTATQGITVRSSHFNEFGSWNPTTGLVLHEGAILNILFTVGWDTAICSMTGATIGCQLRFDDFYDASINNWADLYVPIYLDNKPINGENQFAWLANSEVQFKIGTNEYGHLAAHITSSGAYSKFVQTANQINASVSKKLDQSGSNMEKTFGWNLTADGFYLGTTATPGYGTPEDLAKTVFLCDKNGVIVSGSLIADSLHINNNASFAGIIQTGEVTIDPKYSTIYDVILRSSHVIESSPSASQHIPPDYWTNAPVTVREAVDQDGNIVSKDIVLNDQYFIVTPEASILPLTVKINGLEVNIRKADGTSPGYFAPDSSYTCRLQYSKLEKRTENIPNPDYDESLKDDPNYTVSPTIPKDYYTIVSPQLIYIPPAKGLTINLNDGTLSLNKQMTVNAPGEGYISIGKPLDASAEWDEISIMPMKSGGATGSIGNLGAPKHPWDTVNYSKLNNYSKRSSKTNIQLYNIDSAYEEMKELPIFTFNFVSDSPILKNSSTIGTMIEYIPGEAMLNDGDYTCSYDIGSMVFWDIAATKVLQQKLEDALIRIEELEYQLEELQNGIN